MYTLYFSIGTASFAPQMLLEESNIIHQLVEVDIASGEHLSPEFLSINPTGKVPALRLTNGDILSEAAAICIYLADTHKISDAAPELNDPDRPRFLMSLLYLATSVQDQFKRFYYPERYTENPLHASGIKSKSLELVELTLGPVETLLGKAGPYHLGKRSSVADTYLLMLISWHPQPDKLLEQFPNIARCCELVSSRDIIKAGLKRQTEISVGK